MKKLKHSEIRKERERLLAAQGNRCPISGIKITEAVLDHDHDSGLVRCTLQREVNAFEGKVQNAYNRFIKHLGVSKENILKGLCAYWQYDFSGNKIHRTHKTKEDRMLREYKRRLKASKRESTKEKYRNLIKELKP